MIEGAQNHVQYETRFNSLPAMHMISRTGVLAHLIWIYLMFEKNLPRHLLTYTANYLWVSQRYTNSRRKNTSLCREPNLGLPARSLVTVLTELPR